jgi:hypothetical protein
MVGRMRYRLAIFAMLAGLLPASAAPPVTPVNITASTTATTASFNASLAAVSGRTNYICGFVISSGGTTAAAVVNATVTGTVSGTLNYAYVFPSSGQGVLGVAFPQCVIASGSNTAITVTVPGGGTGTVAALSVWGYQL